MRSWLQPWIPAGLAALAVCALAPHARAEASDALCTLEPLSAPALAAKRAGFRVGGLDVSLDVWVRDAIDGRELPASLRLGGVALDLPGLALPLVNRENDVHVARDARVHVRVDGFQSRFGSPARAARARLGRGRP